MCGMDFWTSVWLRLRFWNKSRVYSILVQLCCKRMFNSVLLHNVVSGQSFKVLFANFRHRQHLTHTNFTQELSLFQCVSCAERQRVSLLNKTTIALAQLYVVYHEPSLSCTVRIDVNTIVTAHGDVEKTAGFLYKCAFSQLQYSTRVCMHGNTPVAGTTYCWGTIVLLNILTPPAARCLSRR